MGAGAESATKDVAGVLGLSLGCLARRASGVGGRSRVIVGLPAVPVVCDCDVAEAARLSAGNRWRWCGRCDALDEHSEVRDEALVEVTAWNMLDAIGIVDLAGGLELGGGPLPWGGAFI